MTSHLQGIFNNINSTYLIRNHGLDGNEMAFLSAGKKKTANKKFFLTKLSFKNEIVIKTFTDKQKLRKCCYQISSKTWTKDSFRLNCSQYMLTIGESL